MHIDLLEQPRGANIIDSAYDKLTEPTTLLLRNLVKFREIQVVNPLLTQRQYSTSLIIWKRYYSVGRRRVVVGRRHQIE